MNPWKSILATLVFLVPPARAEIPPQEAMGLYAHTEYAHRNLSPRWGMAALESGYLANLRFFGAYGSLPAERYPRHPALDRAPQDNCPLDATAAVIQYLFPSPDGDNFVLNERASVKAHILSEATSGHLGTMRLMLDHGADVNATLPDVKDSPVIFQALAYDHFNAFIHDDGGTGDTALGVLLETRPRLNLEVIGPGGHTPLTRAVDVPLGPEKLLAAGADPNFRGPLGSPLEVAATSHQFQAFQTLLAAGADPFRKDAHGRDAVDIARDLEPHRPEFMDALKRSFPERLKDPEAKAGP